MNKTKKKPYWLECTDNQICKLCGAPAEIFTVSPGKASDKTFWCSHSCLVKSKEKNKTK